MDRVKPKDIALVEQLLDLGKPYYSPADLAKVLSQRPPSLNVTLNRLVRSGVLLRLMRGVYHPALRAPDLARIANQLVYPSYLSFESALSRYGILSQVPYALTFATSRRTQSLLLGSTPVQFRQLKEELYFGFSIEGGLYVAEPEKALLDQMYMVSRGRASLTMGELELSALDRDYLSRYASRFPAYVQRMADSI
jgi:predicted transcriptional regulator of viral defense system